MKHISLLALGALSVAPFSLGQTQFGVDRLEAEFVVDDLDTFFTETFIIGNASYFTENDVTLEGLGADVRYSIPWIEKPSWGVDVSGSARAMFNDLTIDSTSTETAFGEETIFKSRYKDSFNQFGVYLGGVYFFKGNGFTPFLQADLGYYNINSDFFDDSGLGWRSKAGIAIEAGEFTLTPRYQIYGLDSDETRKSYGIEVSIPYNQGFSISGAWDYVEEDEFEGNTFSFKGTFLY